MFPLHFIGMLNRFDLECQVSGGGSSGQSGAIRLATAKALRSFVDDATIEKMRQGESSLSIIGPLIHQDV